MKTFKQFIDYIFEGRHDPENEEHRLKLLNVDHSKISKDKNHEYYEDKIHNALKGLNSATHGEDTVKKYLNKFHDSPNRWVRLGVAKNPEVHNHKDIVEKLKGDNSAAVAHAVGGSPVKSSKSSKPSSNNPNIDPSIHPEGKYEKEDGSTSDFKGADKVTHLYHISQEGKRTKVGSVVSKGEDHKAISGGKPLDLNFKSKSHKESLLQLINNHRGYR